MIVCPVCEHVQAQGAECDVCGKKLLHGAAAIPFVPPVDGLEPTARAAVDVAEERVPDLDAGRAAPVDVAGDRVPDLEVGGPAIPDDAPTALPAIAVCRYCRTPALPGERVCGRCGMRLPVFEEPSAEQAPPERRCGCGVLVSGPLCPSCGARLH